MELKHISKSLFPTTDGVEEDRRRADGDMGANLQPLPLTFALGVFCPATAGACPTPLPEAFSQRRERVRLELPGERDELPDDRQRCRPRYSVREHDAHTEPRRAVARLDES